MSALRQARPARAPDVRERHVARSPRAAEGSLGSHRVISLMAALSLFWPIFKAWDSIVAVPVTGIALIALSGGTLWLAGAIATTRDQSRLRRLDVWLLVLGCLVLAASAAATLHSQSGYPTDEAALEQGAATLLLHGHDPYGANLISSLAGFSTPIKYLTYTMSGGIVTSFGYPALPLLIVAPLVQLTGGGQAVPIAGLLMLLLSMVAMFRVLPREWRAAAVLMCAGLPVLSSFALAGLNTVIAMAALLVAGSRWTSTGRGGSISRADGARAAALGLALATNQIAWFIAPFLLSGIYLVRRGDHGPRAARRISLAYAGLAGTVFTAVNLPFILWSPSAWLHGVAAPITQHAIPYGQGLVGLTVFLRLGGGALDAYNYAAGFLYLGVLLVYLARFRTLARAAFLLPLAALFVSGRSLAGYWLAPIAVIAVSALSAEEDAIARAAQLILPRRLAGRSAQRAALGAILLPVAVCLGVALGTPAPLGMRILAARSSPVLRSVQGLTLLVQNRTGKPLRPHFATNTTGQAVMWSVSAGPPTLAAQATAVYRLAAADPTAMPPNGTPFVVQAVTAAPRTISSTPAFVQTGPAPTSW